MKRAVFLDRDGVLNVAVERDGRPSAPFTTGELVICDGVPAALKALKQAGFLLIVVTNQPDVARGAVPREHVEAINTRLLQLLPSLDGVRACFHDDADRCACRKPEPGMLICEATEHDVQLASSFMVGDRWRDIEAGRRAGCRTVLVDSGFRERRFVTPDYTTANLTQAAEWILGPVGGGQGPKNATGGNDRGGATGQLAEGLRTVRAEPGLAALIAFSSVVVFLYGFEQVVHVLVATNRLGMSASGVGVMGAAIGVGGLVVAPFTARLGDGPSAGLLLALTGLLMGVPLVLLAVISSPVVAVIVLLVEGAGGIAFEVLFITLLQRATPEDMLARVFGLQDSVTSVAQLLGSLAAPLLVAGVKLEATLWIGGGLVVVVAVLLAVPLNRLSVRSDAQRRRYAPTVARLRGLPIFDDARQAALERLARAARPRSVPAGQVVFCEGDAADDLFVIVGGTASVRKKAVGEVGRLGVDDWFGEVGLIQGAPRNATVSAIEDLDLLVISGTVFLDALTTNELLPEPLRLSLAFRTSPPVAEETRTPA